MADTSRFPSGVLITQALTTARPVGTIVLNPADNNLYRSTNATVATYTAISGAVGSLSGTVLDGTAITWGTGLDVVASADGTNLVWEQGAGAGLSLWEAGVFRLADTTDNTKRVSFVVSTVTAGQTRSVTWADANLDFRTQSLASQTIADPGTGQAIPVTTSGNLALTMSVPGETNTLAIPTAIGQTLHITVASFVAASTRIITSAQAFNGTGNTVITLDAATDSILLAAASVGGALRWRVVYNDGCALT